MHSCGDSHLSTFDSQESKSDLMHDSANEEKQWPTQVPCAWKKMLESSTILDRELLKQHKKVQVAGPKCIFFSP